MKFYEKLSDASSSASSSAHTSPQGSRSMSPKVGDEGREDGGEFQLRKEREGDWGWRGGEVGEVEREEERTLFPTSSMSVVCIFSFHLISACGVNQKTSV